MPPISPEAVRPEPKQAPLSPEPRVRYTGVNHIALATNHMEKTVRFYRDLLGFRLSAVQRLRVTAEQSGCQRLTGRAKVE